MLSSRICIVPRSMSRITDGAKRSFMIAMLVIAALFGSACDIQQELEARNGNRRANRLFQSMQFIDAAAEYEQALRQVEKPPLTDPNAATRFAVVHYNLGLAYSKMYRPGYEKPILLGEANDPVCGAIPNTKPLEAQVCVKRPDAQDQTDKRRFSECDKPADCSSSFQCKKTKLCTATSAQLADLAAFHLRLWIKAQPSDEALAAELKNVREKIKKAQKEHEDQLAKLPQGDEEAKTGELQRNKAVMDELNKQVDALTLKDDMRKMMTQAWLDTNQYETALNYWKQELTAKPNDPGIMGNIAGIYLKANDWRSAIQWYHKVAEAEPDPGQKVAALNSIGNVAWSKLNSKTLDIKESIELADYGIGAVQKAAEIQPKLAKLYGLQASILNFRSLTHGASFAASIDRSAAQDLLRHSRVLNEEAKKQQQGQAPAAPAPAPAAPAPATAPAAPAAPAPATAPAAPAAPAPAKAPAPAPAAPAPTKAPAAPAPAAPAVPAPAAPAVPAPAAPAPAPAPEPSSPSPPAPTPPAPASSSMSGGPTPKTGG
jgi:tetratricopeptide (TPR) repeat protein